MLKEEIKNIKEEETDLRKFGLTVGTVFFLTSVVLYFFAKNYFVYFAGAGILLLLLGLILPNVLRPLNKIWMTLAIVLGWFMSRVILFILYYVIITPIGFFLKLIGKDFLHRKIDKTSQSYWEIREKKITEQIDYERQF
jgi:hypothetical protein